MRSRIFHFRLAHAGLILALAGGAAATVPLALAANSTGITPVPAVAPVAAGGSGPPGTAPLGSVPAHSSMQTVVQVYDNDYPFMHYGDAPVHNEVAELQQRIARGQVTLTYGSHAFLGSLLSALDIDPESQVLVFSKTSLQIDAISPATPRAIYFNDDTYVAFVQGTGMMEVATMDADRGAVFYSFHTLTTPDQQNHSWRLEREGPRCLTCHDSFAESGGGVPVFMFESAYDLKDMDVIFGDAAHETTEQDPEAGRWGGWYVTGDDGGAFHLGNVYAPARRGPAVMRNSVLREDARKGALQSLSGLLNLAPYIRPGSDIVSLLVLQHEVDVHNAMIRANYKSRVLFMKNPQANVDATTHWRDMPPQMQKMLTALLEPLVRAMVMSDAAGLAAPVKGNTSYAGHFEARGPRDARGRSLRDLDLRTRTFRYPMSFLVYTRAFDFLPVGVREHLYSRFADILTGKDHTGSYGKLDPADCRAALEILKATKPDFARQISG